MAVEFSISLVVSAVTGAAVSALSELGGTVKSLSKAGNVLQAEHARLGRSIVRRWVMAQKAWAR